MFAAIPADTDEANFRQFAGRTCPPEVKAQVEEAFKRLDEARRQLPSPQTANSESSAKRPGPHFGRRSCRVLSWERRETRDAAEAAALRQFADELVDGHGTARRP